MTSVWSLITSMFRLTKQKDLPMEQSDASKPTTKSSIVFAKPKRSVRKVFVHCSASDNPKHDDISVIKQWHLNRKPPFSDVGYHYFIKKDGTVQAGRPLEVVPAAQEGHNVSSIAICLHGLKKENFTQAQFDSLRDLCLQIAKAYDNMITFHGHCEVSTKECPVFDYKSVLQLDKAGKSSLV